MKTDRRCLTMLKGNQRYVFWYAPGREAELLATFVDLAADPHCALDSFDAAVLSYQVGKRVERSRETVTA